MPAKKIAISTHKGGAGKTVTTLAAGAALAHGGHRCLLIDLDPQNHLALGLGIELSDNQPTLNQFFRDYPAFPLADVVVKTHLPTLDLIPADNELAQTAEMLYRHPRKETYLRKALEKLEKSYDWILMDCPPSLGVLTQNALTAADFIVIPSEIGARAPDAVFELLELAKIIKDDDAFQNYGILLTKVDPRKTVSLDVVRAGLKQWEDKVFQTWIPSSEPLNQAQMKGTDIYSFRPKSAGALAYKAFVEELKNNGYSR